MRFSTATFFVLFSVLLPLEALAFTKVGESCQDVGSSTMSSDQKDIVVCLNDDSGKPVWKSMTGTSMPAGIIGAFNASSCPTGWSAADGTNGTLDLRGEFLRGLDNGRGVDAGRNLGSWQPATKVMVDWHSSGMASAGNWEYSVSDFGVLATDSDETTVVTPAIGAGRLNRDATFTYPVVTLYRVRPRNVAVLFCQKE